MSSANQNGWRSAPAVVAAGVFLLTAGNVAAQTSDSETTGDPPNIVFIMGDDIGWFNIGAYNRGIMSSETPHIDQLADEGMLFTDYYAEASCTAGRANFITGQLPLRTGLTTVGQAGAEVGMPSSSPTIATALRELGYATAQFGKNHLGDRNEFLPCLHGFDEFFGYLYHLDAMEDPFNRTYPQDLVDRVGPRNIVSCVATDEVDETVDDRWGRVGAQTITDEGPLPPHPVDGITYNMETFDEEIANRAIDFIHRAHDAGQPFFAWVNPTRMHVFTHLSDQYMDMITSDNNWTLQEAGLAQFDDVIGSIAATLDELEIADNTIIVVTTDNGAEVFSWPDGGQTPFSGTKGMIEEGGFRVPMIVRWPAQIEGGQVNNGVMSGLDWFPTLVAAAGGPDDITDKLQSGWSLDGTEYSVHLDGYNQFDLLTAGAESARNEIWYFAEANLGAVRIGDYKYYFLSQPDGWFGAKVSLDWPSIINQRTDPFERCLNLANCPPAMMDFFAHEFWRFVFVQQEVGALGQSFVDFPPQQAPASFSIDRIVEQVRSRIRGNMGN